MLFVQFDGGGGVHLLYRGSVAGVRQQGVRIAGLALSGCLAHTHEGAQVCQGALSRSSVLGRGAPTTRQGRTTAAPCSPRSRLGEHHMGRNARTMGTGRKQARRSPARRKAAFLCSACPYVSYPKT